MSVSYIEVHGTPLNSFKLEVSVASSLISISAGTIVISGVSYELSDTTEYSFTTKNTRSVLEGHLVLTADSKVAIFVDETLDDGLDVPYTWSSSSFTYFAPIFRIDVPRNTSNLEEIDRIVWRII